MDDFNSSENSPKKITRRDFLKLILNLGKTSVEMVSIAAFISDWIFGYVPESTSVNPKETYTPYPSILLPGNQTLNLIGVSHTKDNFIQHQPDIRHQTQKSDMVLLEYFQEQQRLLSSVNLDLTRYTSPMSVNRSTDLFFAGVGSESAKSSKKIAIINPENAQSQLLELFQLFIVLPGSFTAALTKLEDGSRFMSRREFLIFAGASLVALFDWAGWIGRMESKIEDQQNEFRNYAKSKSSIDNPNLLSFTYLDWRDVATAFQILYLSNVRKGKPENWTMFQGDGHSTGVRSYLRDPYTCSLKREVYASYNLVCTNHIPIYDYDRRSSSWLNIENLH